MNEFYGSGYDVEKKIEIPMKTLDTILTDYPEISLMKIDVQGFEKAVLAGGQNTLKRTKHVIIEANFYPHYEESTLFLELHQQMTELGFSLKNISIPFLVKGNLLWVDAIYSRS
jgi:hypothetical protein